MIPIYSVIKYIDYVTKIILRKINFIFSMAQRETSDKIFDLLENLVTN